MRSHLYSNSMSLLLLTLFLIVDAVHGASINTMASNERELKNPSISTQKPVPYFPTKCGRQYYQPGTRTSPSPAVNKINSWVS
jgi:hypothetical protein